MRLFRRSKQQSRVAAVGPELLAVSTFEGTMLRRSLQKTASNKRQVLPDDQKPWYKTEHLIRLNLILLVPLFSAATIGFDSKSVQVPS